MRTRTLLLLAVACGLVILVAGVVQLLRISDADGTDGDIYALGDDVDVGDMTVVVESYEESGGVATLTLTLGGVDDVDGSEPFRLVVPEHSLSADRAGRADACGATTVEPQRCTLTFDVGAVPGGARFLLYRRGDADARWELVAAAS